MRVKIELLGDHYHVEESTSSQGTLPSPAPAQHAALFLHGFGQSSATWQPVIDALLPLADEAGQPLRIVTLDLLGHGGSDKPEGLDHYLLSHIVEVLDALGAKLELGAFHLVGYSMGGRIALTYAIERPRTLASLVLESASFGPQNAAEKAAALKRDRELAGLLEMSSADEFAEWWLDTPVMEYQRELPPTLRDAEAAMRRANDTRALARVTLGAGQGAMDDLFDAAGHLRPPLLYACGEDDAKYSGLAAIAEGRWGLDVRRFATGHNVHLEQPAEYAAMLLEFWNSKHVRRRVERA